jgi:hypothetical protein
MLRMVVGEVFETPNAGIDTELDVEETMGQNCPSLGGRSILIGE